MEQGEGSERIQAARRSDEGWERSTENPATEGVKSLEEARTSTVSGNPIDIDVILLKTFSGSSFPRRTLYNCVGKV
ncbi:unnamed protein product [Sphagnum jensenii]